jgi:hypothetical protein
MSTPKAANTLDRLRRFYILLKGLRMLGVSHKPIAASGDLHACRNIERLLRRFYMVSCGTRSDKGLDIHCT